MGYLDWRKKRQEKEPQKAPPSSQGEIQRSWQHGELAQDSQAARELRVHIRNEYERVVDEAMVGRKETSIAIARGTEAMNRSLFDCTTKELYEQTGATKRKRDTLPAEAQNAMAAAEVQAAADLDEATFEDDGTSSRIKKVVDMSKGAAERTRRYLPW